MAGRKTQRTLAIDIGGSGIKALVLDRKGKPVTKRVRLPTPEKRGPQSLLKVLESLISEQGDFDRVSVGFPGVVITGEVRTAQNLSPDWIGFNLAQALEESTGRPTRVANDADIQGLAVIEGKGVELVLTLGTGLGSSLFSQGWLVPNLELAHHDFRKGETYEQCLGNAARKRLGTRKWHRRLDQAIRQLGKLLNYRLLYLGGGNAQKIDTVLPENIRIVPNVAGLLGGIKLWR